MDLVFPHHECEIAQSVASQGDDMVHYWMHNNMLTINGQKMGKSLGNFITLNEFFTGEHKMLTQAYTPMTIRFFILQAHYRSTVDFSNEALQAAEKGLARLLDAYKLIAEGQLIPTQVESDYNVDELAIKCYDAMNDDLNTPIVISHLSDAARFINSVYANPDNTHINSGDLTKLDGIFRTFLFDILGLIEEKRNQDNDSIYKEATNILLELRSKAKNNKDWETADYIRNRLSDIGLTIKDTKTGTKLEIQK